MEFYLNRGIKEIIVEFPEVEAILEDYDIGCGPCTVGICQLKDILEIHTLAPDKEQELMARIEAAIYPEREIKTNYTDTSSQTQAKPHVFSPPMQVLVNEHLEIKRWIALIPSLVDTIDLESEMGLGMIMDGIDLIKSYADRLHHGKEEDILFCYFDDSEKIFQVIYEDHRTARNHVDKMITAVEAKDADALGRHLMAYALLLEEHIRKEDEILFPWLDSKLTEAQVLELSEKFNAADGNLGVRTEKYRNYLDDLEHILKT